MNRLLLLKLLTNMTNLGTAKVGVGCFFDQTAQAKNPYQGFPKLGVHFSVGHPNNEDCILWCASRFLYIGN